MNKIKLIMVFVLSSISALASDPVPVSRALLDRSTGKIYRVYCMEYDANAARCGRGFLAVEYKTASKSDILGNVSVGEESRNFLGNEIVQENTDAFQKYVSSLCSVKLADQLEFSLKMKDQRYWQFKPLSISKKLSACLTKVPVWKEPAPLPAWVLTASVQPISSDARLAVLQKMKQAENGISDATTNFDLLIKLQKETGIELTTLSDEFVKTLMLIGNDSTTQVRDTFTKFLNERTSEISVSMLNEGLRVMIQAENGTSDSIQNLFLVLESAKSRKVSFDAELNTFLAVLREVGKESSEEARIMYKKLSE